MYDLNDYVLIGEIQQMTQWGLKIERDTEFFTVIRRKFSGEITVKGTDYDLLIALEGDTKQYAIVIYRECSGVWAEFWKGYFSYFDYKVDLDRCYLSFEPEVWDEYSCVFKQFEVERNVLAAGTGTSVFFDSFSYEIENMTETSTAFAHPGPAVFAEWSGGGKYYLYSQSVKTQFVGAGISYLVVRVYKREVTEYDDGVNAPAGFVTNGAMVEQLEPDLWKWARPIGDLNYSTYISTTSGLWEHETLDLTLESYNIELTGCITLNSVLTYFNTFTGLVYDSDFFGDDPCPMGDTTLKYTMIQQISNVRETDDPATRGMMKLKDLLLWIRDTFNAYWYIDSVGNFRIEHRKYFDWGLSYTGPAAISLDLGALYPDNVLKLRRYEWSRPSLYRWERLEIPYSFFDDWIDASIEYPQYSIRGGESLIRNVTWGTDIVAMYEARNELPKQGWTLLNVDWVGSSGIFILKVINSVGAISGVGFPNTRFSQANLFRDLWTWGRLAETGQVNGVDTTFDSIERLKKQVELNFPQCCQDVDYNGIFRTPLGDGLLDAAEYEAKSGNLKIQLIYE